MESIIIIIDFLAISLFLICAIKFQLQMLQQSSYRNVRYMRWFKSNIGLPIYGSLAVLVALIFMRGLVGITIISALLALVAIYMATRKSKKPIVFTPRVVRLFSTSIILSIIKGISVYLYSGDILLAATSLIAFAMFMPLVVMVANIILTPVEMAINNWYIADAKRILASMPNLTIIGITGSYGKTSTKHFLHRLLSEKYNTLMTPGSYNTTLGVVRTIREQLKPYHNIFIVEMGAKEVGDIAEICNIVHPTIGIVTSIGEQHLETFKSVENIQKTKFELIDSLPTNGFAVINNDFELIASREVTNLSNVVRYGATSGIDLTLDSISYGVGGSEFTINDKIAAERVSFRTSVLGRHNISNIMACYAVASHLGVKKELMACAIERIESVEHRLQVRHASGGVIVIDDAYNSNPQGADMALEVLGGFAPMKRVLITPGMIELGDRQWELNMAFGAKAAGCVDYAIIVGRYNSEAIVKGLESEGFPKGQIYEAVTLADGVKHLTESFSSQSYVVLYENDLPDTFK